MCVREHKTMETKKAETKKMFLSVVGSMFLKEHIKLYCCLNTSKNKLELAIWIREVKKTLKLIKII